MLGLLTGLLPTWMLLGCSCVVTAFYRHWHFRRYRLGYRLGYRHWHFRRYRLGYRWVTAIGTSAVTASGLPPLALPPLPPAALRRPPFDWHFRRYRLGYRSGYFHGRHGYYHHLCAHYRDLRRSYWLNTDHVACVMVPFDLAS